MYCVVRTCWQIFFWPIIDDMDVSGMWFQQECAICHTAIEIFNLLQTKFHAQISSKFIKNYCPEMFFA